MIRSKRMAEGFDLAGFASFDLDRSAEGRIDFTSSFSMITFVVNDLSFPFPSLFTYTTPKRRMDTVLALCTDCVAWLLGCTIGSEEYGSSTELWTVSRTHHLQSTHIHDWLQLPNPYRNEDDPLPILLLRTPGHRSRVRSVQNSTIKRRTRRLPIPRKCVTNRKYAK